MYDDRRLIGLGRVISIVGAAWLGLFFLTRTGLFGSNPFTTIIQGMGAFFPIAMMFVGRIIRRRASPRPVEIEQPARPVPRPRPRPQTRPPDPVSHENLADAIRFEKVEEKPESVDPERMPKSMHEDVESMAEDVDAMTSEEMLAEAKKRYSSEN